MKKIIFIAIIFILTFNISYADNVYFMDFSKVLNTSIAGKKAQVFLKNKFSKEQDKFKKIEKEILDEERSLISKKKLISAEEYQKNIITLREKVANLQKNKQSSINNIAKLRNNAKKELLSKLNPILKSYMENKRIRVVIDKKEVLYGDSNLEITAQVIEILNKKVKTLSLK
jgi:Skp family chaperone for outer membrane proteins|tara:strand:- start:63 stop:578 length:516 start_codon:yes stop_codon:yes gene_type:complete